MSGLNWRLIGALSTFGPLVGALVVLGVFPNGSESYAWLVYSIAVAFIAVVRTANPFWNAAVTGFVSGASATLVQGLFVDTFLANNPWVAERFAEAPEQFNFQYFVLMLVPFIGIASGLLVGLLTHLAGRVVRRNGGS